MKIVEQFQFSLNQTNLMTTLHEDLCVFLQILLHIYQREKYFKRKL
jgi:hypothetical protein